MDNKFVLAKNYNYQQDYQLNAYIDAKDSVNHWCVAQVVDVDEDKNQIKVHFEGWSSRYDEWVKKNSQRITTFRRHTEGYTGQKKNAFRDFKISYTHNKFMQQKVQEIIKEEFKNFESPQKLTQFIRGELYFYIDSLISLFTTTQAEDLQSIFDFMKDVFLLIFKWMEIFPQYLSSFQDSIHHPQLYLVSYDAAIAQCGNEIFGIFEKCFNRCPRCQRFFQKFASEYLATEGENSFASKEKVKNFGLMSSFLNAFGNMGGFEKVLNFINFDVKDSKDKIAKGCPFTIVMKVLQSLQSVFEISDKNFSQKFAEDVCFALTCRLDFLSDSEIKELDKDILRGIIEVQKEYMMIIMPSEADKTAELRELQIAQKYLRCPFFEKRVRGINELKEIYYKVNNSTVKGRNNDQYQYTKWLTFEKYSQWITSEKIIDFIFMENPHVELIKRSTEIMRLLAMDERYFSSEIIEMLWICASEKHEDIVRATLDLVQDLASIMPLERLCQFSIKLRTFKENDFDEKLVIFLKNFTLNSMKNIRAIKKGDGKSGLMGNILSKKKEVKIDESKYIDLNLFWQIFQDHNKVSQKVKELALNSLIEILQDFNDKDAKDSFTLLAIDNIKKGQTFYSSIIFLRKIINTYPLDSQIKFKSTNTVTTVQMLLFEIYKKNDLFFMIFQNLDDYLKIANQAKIRLGVTGDKIQSQLFVGYSTHEDYISVVMNFIEFVIVNSKVILSYDAIEKMFQLLVVNAVSEYESNAFFQLVTKENDNAKSKERRFLLDDKTRNEVFLKIFCNSKTLNFEKINIEGFNCFKRLFLIVNEEEKALEIQKDNRIVVTNLNSLQGIETLWSFAILCSSNQVKEVSRDFLVDLYLKIKTKSSAQKKQSNEFFPQKCFAHFKQSNDKPDNQLNCLKLIKTYISRFDGDHIQEEDMSQFPVQELKAIGVTLNPDKATIQVKVHQNQKFWQLKRKIANQFKMRLSEFYIKTKTGPLDESVYDDVVKDYKIDHLHINRHTQEDMEKEFPRYIIGYNQDFLNLFLDMLKQGKEECKREVLTLLEILPINNDVKLYVREQIVNKMIVNQGEKQQEQWQKLFQWNFIQQELTTCLYFLMSLEDLMIPKRDLMTPEQNQQDVQIKAEFTTRLLQNGGFQFLFDLFTSINKQKLERDIIKTKVLTLVLKMIQHLFVYKQTSYFKQIVTPQFLEVLIQETLSIIENYVTGAYQQQLYGIPAGEDVRLLGKELQILQNSCLFLNRALQFNHQQTQTLYSYSGIANIFKIALIDLDIKQVQEQTQSLVLDLSVRLDQDEELLQKPSFFFMKMFINEFLEYSLKVSGTTVIFFDIFNQVFMKTDTYKDLHLIKPVELLIKEITDLILIRDTKEITARDEDIPLQGLFFILKNIFKRFPQVRDQFEAKNSLLQYLIHDCLFHKETSVLQINKQKAMPPKCKNNNTRERCLELLNELCISNSEGIQLLIRYLKDQISETFWRTPRKSDWSITVHQQERSLTGFVGLKNIGCICYMNSIMQQLFMLPTFRKAILEVEDANFGKESNEENVLHQLKMIFGGLMEIEKQYFNPKKFCSAFKDIDGSPIDPMVQKDVDEFFNMAMDRVENLVKGKKEDKVIKNLFQGVLANEFICKGCPHYSEREEPFMTVSLQVKNKHSIRESLEAFVEGEMLEGDNAYYCEKCEKKVNTLKRCCIKRMPNVLFMVLKRFEFNFDTMSKFKINDYCEFPMQINMREYSQEMLTKKDLLKKMEDQNMTMEDLSEEQRAILDKDLPSKYYDYNLRGTVIHIGTAEQGHYISYIQDRENQPNNKWYEFNDHLVREFDPEDIPNEAFGGEDETFVNNLNLSTIQGSNEQVQLAMKQLKSKIKNAYILIYEREEVIDMERFNEFMDDPNINTSKLDINQKFESCKLPKTTSAQIQIPPQIHDFILEKNKKFWLSKFIFNRTYIESVLNIFSTIEIEEEMEYALAREADLQVKSGKQFEMFKFLTTFFFTTVIRAKERKSIPALMAIIREALKKNVLLSVWLLESFVNQNLIKEFLIDCPIPDMKRFVAGLLKTAMQTVYKFEELSIQSYCQQSESVDYVLHTQASFVKQHRLIDMKLPLTRGEQINSGPCQNLNIITLTHHSEKLPILIIMINSFIHLNVSPHYFLNQRLTAQFYQVFAHFSELGEQARLYLLKTKTVGRMLDLFFYEQQGNKALPHVSEKFRSTSLMNIPLFQLEKELYMESNLEKNDVKISNQEKKIALSEATQQYMFLLFTVSKLSRSCIFVKDSAPSTLANDTLNFMLDDDELAMIINHENPKLWDLCESKLTRNVVADMYAHISFDNREFSYQFLTTIFNGLQKVTFNQMKVYERPLIGLLMVNDQYQIDRTKKAISGIHDIMKLNVSYYKEFDSIIDIIYKLAQKSSVAIEIINKSQNLIRFIEQWSKENPHFPLNQQKASRVFRQGIVPWNTLKQNSINQQTLDKVQIYAKDRLQKLMSLINKETQPNENTIDSDDDQYHHEFQPKERLDFSDPQQTNLYSGSVEIALDEMVKCVPEATQYAPKTNSIWVATETDNIGALNSFMSEKKRMHRFYLDLLKYVNN